MIMEIFFLSCTYGIVRAGRGIHDDAFDAIDPLRGVVLGQRGAAGGGPSNRLAISLMAASPWPPLAALAHSRCASARTAVGSLSASAASSSRIRSRNMNGFGCRCRRGLPEPGLAVIGLVDRRLADLGLADLRLAVVMDLKLLSCCPPIPAIPHAIRPPCVQRPTGRSRISRAAVIVLRLSRSWLESWNGSMPSSKAKSRPAGFPGAAHALCNDKECTVFRRTGQLAAGARTLRFRVRDPS